MDYNMVVKIFGDVIKDLSPEFREKYFGKISLCVIGLVAIPAVTEFGKYCVDKFTYRDCYIAAVENGLITKEALNAAEPILPNLPATT